MNRLSPLLLAAALLSGCAAQVPAPPDTHHPASPEAAAGPGYQITPLTDDTTPATAPSDTAAPSDGGHHHGH